MYVPFSYLFRAYSRKGASAITELYQKEVGPAASARLARISPLGRLGNARRSENANSLYFSIVHRALAKCTREKERERTGLKRGGEGWGDVCSSWKVNSTAFHTRATRSANPILTGTTLTELRWLRFHGERDYLPCLHAPTRAVASFMQSIGKD